MQLADLPSRRNEAWKWSDLRAALAGDEAKIATVPTRAGSVIAALAGGAAPEVRVAKDQVVVSRLGGGDGYGATSAAYEIEPGATLTRIVLQPVDAGVVLDEATVRLGAGATFRQFVLASGAKLARIETTVEIAGEGARVELNGVYLASEKRHSDLTSLIRQVAQGGVTRQTVRGAARSGGRGVFQGKIKVERGAQKTDAEMNHNALLLDQGAEVFAKPELEIYADDVSCSHGNTAGQLDETAVFYLRSRGLPEVDARALITRAFLFEALPDWLGDTREEIEQRIDRWLAGGHHA